MPSSPGRRPPAGGRAGDTTAKRLAGEGGVDEKTLRRAADFGRALDIVAEGTSDAFRIQVLAGKLKKLTRPQISPLSRLRPSELRATVPGLLAKGEWDQGPKPPPPTPVEARRKSWAKLKEEERREFLAGLLAEDGDAAALLEPARGGSQVTERAGGVDEGPDAGEEGEVVGPQDANEDDEPAPRRTARP